MLGDKVEAQLMECLTADDVRDRMVIVDEADYCIENYCCTFYPPQGMIALKSANRIYFMSATYDNFH